MGDYLMSYIAIGGRQKKTLGKMGNLGAFVKFLLVLVFGVVVELLGVSGQLQRGCPVATLWNPVFMRDQVN